MLPLGEYNLVLPELPTEEEWLRSIADLDDGMAKHASIVRAKGSNLLKEVQEPKATTERIGWLSLWAKTLAALEAATTAFEYQSNFALQSISRSTFEWDLHAAILVDPIFDLINREQSSSKVSVHSRSRDCFLRQTVDRLRAYTAWCLWSDRTYYAELIHPKTITGVWDPSPAREILADRQSLNGYESFFGKLEAEVDEAKLRESQHDMIREYRQRIKRIDCWLSDERLKIWIRKIKSVSKSKGIPFFSLFGSKNTVPKQLHKHDLRFGYSTYIKGSMYLHGSSMDEFIVVEDSVISPKIKTGLAHSEGTFEQIVSACNRIFIFLGMIDHFVLKRPEIRT